MRHVIKETLAGQRNKISRYRKMDCCMRYVGMSAHLAQVYLPSFARHCVEPSKLSVVRYIGIMCWKMKRKEQRAGS